MEAKMKDRQRAFGLITVALALIWTGCASAQGNEAGKIAKWDVIYQGTELPAPPWKISGSGINCTAEIKDGALLTADRGTGKGEYLCYGYQWNIRPTDEVVLEVKMKLVSASEYSAMGITNGGTVSEVIKFCPDRVSLAFSGKSCRVRTDDAFHIYRIVIQNKDVKLYVDGELEIDAKDALVYRPEYKDRNAISFGAGGSELIDESLWAYVRWAVNPAK
jgi:hypothetical protein